MVPVCIRGFEGLKERIEFQKSAITSVSQCLELLHTSIDSIRTSVSECEKMARQCDSKQQILEEKMIRVLGRVETQLSRSHMVVTNEAFIENMTSLRRLITLPAYP